MKMYMDKIQREEDRRLIDMEAEKMRNDARLRAFESNGEDEQTKRMSKKRKMKMEKIMRDESLTEDQKAMMKSECLEDKQDLKR